MINWFLRRKTENTNSQKPSLMDIKQADKILFALFTRYGDTVIDLVVIREFIEEYSKKSYLILCPRQMEPYVNELLPNISCITLNKRNIYDMLRVNKILKTWGADLGFNPWSNGLDSCYFLTYCKHYQCYKDFKRPSIINHYNVVREYLNLRPKDWELQELKVKSYYNNILLCPQSTDISREMTQSEIDSIIKKVQTKYQGSNIVIASMNASHFREGHGALLFKKTKNSSKQFLSLIKESDLVISVDSGPLHISTALNKDTLAIFNTTKPDIVINSNSTIGYADLL